MRNLCSLQEARHGRRDIALVKMTAKKIEVKKCPHCTDEIMVQLKDGKIEVFECQNCKFKVRENEK